MEPRRILVVANQTACGDELLDVVRQRVADGPCRFTMLVPATPPREHVTWTEGDARSLAKRRLAEAMERMESVGAEVEGVIGDASPLQAIDDTLIDNPHDEIILSTLPVGISRWLKMDLPHRVEQRFALPVTALISQRQPTGS
jgi:GABA permease